MPLYSTWKSMKDRCNSNTPNSKKNYKDKGIKVCDRWLGKEGLSNFLQDMGEKPTREHTIERLDGAMDYSPGNCIWATMTTQSNNTSRNKRYQYKGETKTISQWSKEYNLHRGTLRVRINKGWTMEKALLTEPSHGNKWLELGELVK